MRDNDDSAEKHSDSRRPANGPVTRGEFNEQRDSLLGAYNRFGQRVSLGAIGELNEKVDRTNEKLDELIARRGVLGSNISRAFWGALGIVFAAVLLAWLHLVNPSLP